MAQRYPAILKYCPGPDRELLLAALTAPAVVSLPLSGLGVRHLIDSHVPALGAAWTAFPALGFHEFHGGFFRGTGQWEGLGWDIALGGPVLD